MKIGIDLSIANINQAGSGIYARSLANALKGLNDGNEYSIFAVSQKHDMERSKTIRSRLETLYRDILWMHVCLPSRVARAGVDVLHTLTSVAPVTSPCKTVVTILDTTLFQFPQYFPVWHRTYARLLTPLSAKRASKIITISQQSKVDIVQQFQVPPEKVVVTYPAVSPEFHPASREAIIAVKKQHDLGPFVLTVGTLQPRKNVVRLLQAFAILREAGLPHQLVHVGPRGWMFDDIMLEVRRLGLENNTRFLGRVSLFELISLYTAASVFAYPSLYEGFGLPVLEAMACGCPVVTSNISSLPEVAGDAGITVDPRDVQQIAEAIQRILQDRELAQELRFRGIERAKHFSWARCAQETVDVYREVVE